MNIPPASTISNAAPGTAPPGGASRQSPPEGSGFAALVMAQQDQGAPQAGKPVVEKPAKTPPFDRLMAAAGQLMRDGAARLRAAGEDPEARAAAMAGTQSALQDMIHTFDTAQGADLGARVEALLSGAPGAEATAGPGETIAAMITAMADASGGTIESVMAAMNIDVPAPNAAPGMAAAIAAPGMSVASGAPGMAAAPARPESTARPTPGLAAQITASLSVPAQGRSMPSGPGQAPAPRGEGKTVGPAAVAGQTAMAASFPATPGPSARGADTPFADAPVAVSTAGAAGAARLPEGMTPQGATQTMAGLEPASPAPAASGGAPQVEAMGAPRSFAALIGEAITKSAEAAPEAPVSTTEAAARETELPGAAASSRPQDTVTGPRPAMVSPPAPAPAPAPPSHGFSRALTGQIKGTAFAEGRTRIALTPGGLGEIEIDLAQEAGQLRVVIRAENQGVLQALRDDRDGLAALLGEAGAGVDDDQLSFESFERRDDAPPRRDRPGGSPAILTDADPEAASPDPAPSPVSQGGEGRLDMFT